MKTRSTALTTERVLTSARAFGLTTASPLQRAICRVVDGAPLGDLADRDDVRGALGGASALDDLPTTAPAEIVILAAIRAAKSMLSAARIITLARSVDVSGCAVGDVVRIGVIATKVANTAAVMGHLSASLSSSPLLRPLAIGEPTRDRVVLRHPSGRAIEVEPIPLDRAGASLVSTWLAGVVLDEAPRMIGAADGVRNYTHARDAILGRILPGGQILSIGSPWAPFGPIYDAVREHFGSPSPDLVVVRGKGPDLNPSYWTPERCASLKRRNVTAYRTDVLADFADAEEALIGADDLAAVTRSAPFDLPRESGRVYVAAVDPASRRNAFTLSIVTSHVVDGATHYRVVLHRQWLAPRGGSIDLDRTWAQIAATCKAYGIARLASDGYSVDAMRVIARRHGVEIEEIVTTAASKLDSFERLRTVIAAKQIEIPPCAVTRSDLLSIQKRVTQNGVAIHLPTTADGRHADYASSLALAVHVASQRPAATFRCPEPLISHWADQPAGFEGLDHPGDDGPGAETFRRAAARSGAAQVSAIPFPTSIGDSSTAAPREIPLGIWGAGGGGDNPFGGRDNGGGNPFDGF